MEAEPASQADRNMLADLFKEIAAFGRRIRERHTAKVAASSVVIIFREPELVPGEDKKLAG